MNRKKGAYRKPGTGEESYKQEEEGRNRRKKLGTEEGS